VFSCASEFVFASAAFFVIPTQVCRAAEESYKQKYKI
jgi:hypothetical protein